MMDHDFNHHDYNLNDLQDSFLGWTCYKADEGLQKVNEEKEIRSNEDIGSDKNVQRMEKRLWN